MQQRSSTDPSHIYPEFDIRGHPIRLHLEVSGPEDGRYIFLLHGWGSSAAAMRPLQSALQVENRIVNVDFPGHGMSPDPRVPLDVADQASLLRRVINSFETSDVTLVGHSNGGRVALYLCSEIDPPAAVRRLVLLSPSGVRRKRPPSFYIRSWLARVLKAPFTLLPERPRAFAMDWLRHSLVWKLLGSADYRSLTGVMRETFVRTVNEYLEERLPRVSVPVLLLGGEHDESVTPLQMRTFEQFLPDAGLVMLPETGHFAFNENPAAVVAGIRELMQQS